MRTIPFGFLFFFLLTVARSDDSIELPWGTAVKIADFKVRTNWTTAFPPQEPFFAEKYANGRLKGLHGRNKTKQDGASIVLYESGKPKMLAFYREGQRAGAVRLWNEDKRLVLYSKFENGKKQGVTCLFRNGDPWLIQEWDQGVRQDETLLAGEGSVFLPVDDDQQLAEARKTLAGVEKQLAQMENDVRKRMKNWLADEEKRIKQEKDDILKPVVRAQNEERDQMNKKQLAEEYRATADIISRTQKKPIAEMAKAEKDAASRASQMASKDLKDAQKNVKELTIEAQRELEKKEREIAGRYQELYRFAIAELQESLPEGKPPLSSEGADEPAGRR